jgi:membrane protein implicated in regulation of membrane protease activity
MLGVSISGIASLGILVCWIIVLIHMFKAGVIQGILGLICGLYAFIWGWIHARGELRNVMVLWTILAIVALIFGYRWLPGIPFYR